MLRGPFGSTAVCAAAFLAFGVAGPLPAASAQSDPMGFMREFGQAREALDSDYREQKNECRRQYSIKGAPERDSAKYRRCINDLDQRFVKKRCDFYIEWYERSEQRFGLTRPENYPHCARYY